MGKKRKHNKKLGLYTQAQVEINVKIMTPFHAAYENCEQMSMYLYQEGYKYNTYQLASILKLRRGAI